MKKFMAVFLVAVVTLSMTAGCASGKEAPDSQSSSSGMAQASEAGVPEKAWIDDSKLSDEYGLTSDYTAYPMKGNPTVSMWWPIDPVIASTLEGGTLASHEVFKELQRLTGVKINFVHPAVGQESEQFTLMVSSGDFPDIVVTADRYPGGITAGIADGMYIDPTETIQKYSPNYQAFRESDEMRRKTTMDDSGRITGWWSLSPYSEWIWFGPLVKNEALQKTGLSIPETVDEWYAFLKKAKEVGYARPLNFGSTSGTVWTGLLCGAFGTWDWLYQKEPGVIGWGPEEPGMRDYLEMMQKWYKEGLINTDFTTADFTQRMAEAVSSDTAIMMDSPDTMSAIWKGQKNIDFSGMPYPVLKKGDVPQSTMLSYKNVGMPAAITTKCKNVEAAARLLDFNYTKKGWELVNFGLETTHAIDEKGFPYYPDDSIIFHNPYKLALSDVINIYRIHIAPSVRDEHHSNPLIVQKGSYSGDIRKSWQEGLKFDVSIPPLQFTDEESGRIGKIGTDLSTLRTETFTKIIIGELPISAYDKFLTQARQMGSQELKDIYQASLKRYNAR